MVTQHARVSTTLVETVETVETKSPPEMLMCLSADALNRPQHCHNLPQNLGVIADDGFEVGVAGQ